MNFTVGQLCLLLFLAWFFPLGAFVLFIAFLLLQSPQKPHDEV